MLISMTQLITLVTFIACIIRTFMFILAVIDFLLPLPGSVGTGVHLLLHLVFHAIKIRMLRLVKPQSIFFRSVIYTIKAPLFWNTDYNISMIGNATCIYILLLMPTQKHIYLSDINVIY